MTSCNSLPASFGASSSSVRFHSLGVLFKGVTLPVFIMHANSGPNQTHCPYCVMCFTDIRGPCTSACRGSMVIGLLSAPLATSRRRPPSHATDLPAIEYGTPAAASHRTQCPRVAGCRAGTTVLHAAMSTPNVICLYFMSNLTPTACPTAPMLWPVSLLRNQLSRQFLVSMFIPIVVRTLVGIHQLNFVIIRQLVLDPSRHFSRSCCCRS